jgi:hypothetical protein
MIEKLESRALCAVLDAVGDAPPAPPIEVVGTWRYDGLVRLAFTDDSTNEQHFVIEWARYGGQFEQLGTVSGSQPGATGGRFFFDAFPRATGFFPFRVRAVNDAGASDPSESVVLGVGVGPPRGTGVMYFYNDRHFGGDAIVVEDYLKTDVNYRDGAPAPSVHPDDFSLVWEASLPAEHTERYTFYTASNDGIALRLTDPRDGRVLVDFDHLDATRELPATGFQDVAGSADLEQGVRYLLNVRYSENTGDAGYRVGWSSFSTPQEAIPTYALWSIAAGGPKVIGVSAGSTTWGPVFRGRNDASVPFGANQFHPLPWTALDQVRVQFDRMVDVQREDLVLRGVGGGMYPLSGFEPPSLDNAYTATWTLGSRIGADRLELTLNADPNAGGVFGLDDGHQALDGEWVDGVTDKRSGDGRPGGDFHFRFNVLPGDVNGDGTVLADDFADVKRRFFTTSNNPGPGDNPTSYNYRADVDGSGGILADDYAEVKKRFFTTLPDAPAPTMAAATGAALRTSPVRRDLFGVRPVL